MRDLRIWSFLNLGSELNLTDKSHPRGQHPAVILRWDLWKALCKISISKILIMKERIPREPSNPTLNCHSELFLDSKKTASSSRLFHIDQLQQKHHELIRLWTRSENLIQECSLTHQWRVQMLTLRLWSSLNLTTISFLHQDLICRQHSPLVTTTASIS